MTILGLPHSTVREIKIGRSFEFGRLTPMEMNHPKVDCNGDYTTIETVGVLMEPI